MRNFPCVVRPPQTGAISCRSRSWRLPNSLFLRNRFNGYQWIIICSLTGLTGKETTWQDFSESSSIHHLALQYDVRFCESTGTASTSPASIRIQSLLDVQGRQGSTISNKARRGGWNCVKVPALCRFVTGIKVRSCQSTSMFCGGTRLRLDMV